MKEHEKDVFVEDTWWTIGAKLHGEEQVELYIMAGGIRQDVYPGTVAMHAMSLWKQWLTEA